MLRGNPHLRYATSTNDPIDKEGEQGWEFTNAYDGKQRCDLSLQSEGSRQAHLLHNLQAVLQGPKNENLVLRQVKQTRPFSKSSSWWGGRGELSNSAFVLTNRMCITSFTGRGIEGLVKTDVTFSTMTTTAIAQNISAFLFWIIFVWSLAQEQSRGKKNKFEVLR